MPFCVVWAFFTQATSPRPVFLRQKSQIGDVAIIESDPFLHFGWESERICGDACGFLHVLLLSTSETQSDLVGSSPLQCGHPHLLHWFLQQPKEKRKRRCAWRVSHTLGCKNLSTLQAQATTVAPTPSQKSLPHERNRSWWGLKCPRAVYRARARAHTHSAPCSHRENAQSPDRSPELQISAPWTETPRINTDGERRDSRRESQSLSGGFSGMKTRTHKRAFTYTPNITRDQCSESVFLCVHWNSQARESPEGTLDPLLNIQLLSQFKAFS